MVLISDQVHSLLSNFEPTDLVIDFLVNAISCKVPMHLKLLRDVLIRHGNSIKKGNPDVWYQVQTQKFMNSEQGDPWGSPLLQQIVCFFCTGESNWSIEDNIIDHKCLNLPFIVLVLSLVSFCLAPDPISYVYRRPTSLHSTKLNPKMQKRLQLSSHHTTWAPYTSGHLNIMQLIRCPMWSCIHGHLSYSEERSEGSEIKFWANLLFISYFI
jgi:hypothetical protein